MVRPGSGRFGVGFWVRFWVGLRARFSTEGVSDPGGRELWIKSTIALNAYVIRRPLAAGPTGDDVRLPLSKTVDRLPGGGNPSDVVVDLTG